MTDGDLSKEVTAESPGDGASRPAHTPSIPAGTNLAHFVVLELLGRGGFGEVYRARDTRLSRMVALKVLRSEVATGELRERLRREAVAASALSHPGICTVHDLVEAEGRLLIVMELVEGRTLLEAVSAGPLPAAEAVAITMKIAAALAEAHRAGILHRDVKAGNIMLTPSGEVFSLGVVLYEMLAGRRPFQGSSAIATADAILHSPSPPLTSASVPEQLKAAVHRLLEKDPARRYASAAELMAELRGVETKTARRLRWRRARPMVALGAAAALIAALAVGWLWHRASRARWARETAALEIARLVAADEFTKAATLAEAARSVLPGDARLEKLWSASTLEVSLDSVPTGADVSYRELGVGPSAWRIIGQTPLTKVRVPKAYYLWRIEKPGFHAAYQIWPTWVLRGTGEMQVRLDDDASVPAKMMHVTAGTVELAIPGLDHLPAVTLGDYLIVWRGRRALPGLDGPARPGDVGAGSVPEG